MTCRLIGGSLGHITTLDIRGNKITDEGIVKIIHSIPDLKSLMISECDATDKSGNEIADKLSSLEMLWSEYTSFSDDVSIRIAQKPKLRVLSLAGNKLSQKAIDKIKKIWNCKGYIML